MVQVGDLGYYSAPVMKSTNFHLTLEIKLEKESMNEKTDNKHETQDTSNEQQRFEVQTLLIQSPSCV